MNRTRISLCLLFCPLLMACSSESGHGAADGSTSDGGGGGDDPCSAEALSEPTAATTYYFAVNEPGADNEACNGLAPTDEGNGRCPFKDPSSPAVKAVLDNSADVRVEFREGTYIIRGWDGLQIRGAGESESQRLIVSAYPGETPIFDVPDLAGVGCATDPRSNPDCVRQVIRVSGKYTWVQGITVQNGLAYDLEVNGGAHHVVRCNTFRYTAEFDQRSDQLKLDAGADDVQVQHNEFSGWRSQAIDMTQVFNVIVEHNDFHDPFDPDGGATGVKFGSNNVIIRNNTIHDLGSDPQAHVFALGGTGSPHNDDFAAYKVHVVGNRVWNVAGKLAQLVSCKACTLEDNVAYDIGAGVLFSASGSETPGECTTAPEGICRPSEGTRISGNRLTATSDIFIVAEAGQTAGFVGEGNIYCASTIDAARFGWQPTKDDPIDMVALSEWQALSGTDATSQVLVAGAPACVAR